MPTHLKLTTQYFDQRINSIGNKISPMNLGRLGSLDWKSNSANTNQEAASWSNKPQSQLRVDISKWHRNIGLGHLGDWKAEIQMKE